MELAFQKVLSYQKLMIKYTPELLDELFAEAIAEEERGEPLEFDPDVIPRIL